MRSSIVLFIVFTIICQIDVSNGRLCHAGDIFIDTGKQMPVLYAVVDDCSGTDWHAKPFEQMRIQYFLKKSVHKNLSSDSVEFLRKCMDETVTYFQDNLSVRRATQPIGVEKPTDCGAAEFPDHHRDPSKACDATTTGGVPNVDFIVYVDAEQTSNCGDGTLAYAQPCARGKLDRRPVIGTVNVCPSHVAAKAWNHDATVSTLKHELMHALIFGQNLMKQFYDGSAEAVKDTLMTVKRTWRINKETEHSYEATLVVTPRVKEFVRKHFNCPELEGAELENEGTDGTKGSHWEKRLFGPELMTGMISRRSYFSRLTVALMEDSGWYKANVTMGEEMKYGKGKGCVFAQKSCREYMDSFDGGMDTTEKAKPYCNWGDYIEKRKYDSAKRVCSGDRKYITFCDWGTMPEPHKQYFKDMKGSFGGDGVTGRSGLTDGCPTWTDAYYGAGSTKGRHGDSICTNKDSQPRANTNMGAELYGHDSLCIQQDGKFEAYKCDEYAGAAAMGAEWEKSHGAGCYRYKCHKGRLFLQANYSTGGNFYMMAWKCCWSSNTTIAIRRRQRSADKYGMRYHKGDLKCPPCADLCEGNARYSGFKCQPDVRINTMDIMKNPCSSSAKNGPSKMILLVTVIMVIFMN